MRSASEPCTASAWIPATCGELLQGVDKDGPVLVSLPLQRTGRVDVELVAEPGLTVTPPRPRAAAALHLAVDAVGWPGGARARLKSSLPTGRGLGTSTIDVAGVIAATHAAAGRNLDEASLLRLATTVEPTNSSPFAGLVAIDHVSGRRLRPVGAVPPLIAVAVDAGPPVDTLSIHRCHGAGPVIPHRTLDDLIAAVDAGDVATIGRIATESARRNQQRLFHPAFDIITGTSAAVGTPGVCVAHSGTLAAVLCVDRASAKEAASRLAHDGLRTSVYRIRAGGSRIHSGAVGARRLSSAGWVGSGQCDAPSGSNVARN